MKSLNRSQRAARLGLFMALLAAFPISFILGTYNEWWGKPSDINLAYAAFAGLVTVALVNSTGQALLKSIEWSTDKPNATTSARPGAEDDNAE